MTANDPAVCSPLVRHVEAGRDLWHFLTTSEIAELYAPGDSHLQEEYEARLWKSLSEGRLQFGDPALHDRRSGSLAALGMIHCQEFGRFIHEDGKPAERKRISDSHLADWINISQPPAETAAAKLGRYRQLSEDEALGLLDNVARDKLRSFLSLADAWENSPERAEPLDISSDSEPLDGSRTERPQPFFPCSPQRLARLAYEAGVRLPPEFVRQVAWILPPSCVNRPLAERTVAGEPPSGSLTRKSVDRAKPTKPFSVEYPLYVGEVIKAVLRTPRSPNLPLTSYIHMIWIAAEQPFIHLVLNTEGLRKKVPDERTAKDFIGPIVAALSEPLGRLSEKHQDSPE